MNAIQKSVGTSIDNVGSRSSTIAEMGEKVKLRARKLIGAVVIPLCKAGMFLSYLNNRRQTALTPLNTGFIFHSSRTSNTTRSAHSILTLSYNHLYASDTLHCRGLIGYHEARITLEHETRTSRQCPNTPCDRSRVKDNSGTKELKDPRLITLLISIVVPVYRRLKLTQKSLAVVLGATTYQVQKAILHSRVHFPGALVPPAKRTLQRISRRVMSHYLSFITSNKCIRVLDASAKHRTRAERIASKAHLLKVYNETCASAGISLSDRVGRTFFTRTGHLRLVTRQREVSAFVLLATFVARKHSNCITAGSSRCSKRP